MTNLKKNQGAEELKREITERDSDGVFQIHGDKSTFNISDLLIKNIVLNGYFKALFAYRSPEELFDNISKVKYIEMWGAGGLGMPSYFSCALYRLFLLKLTEEQLRKTLTYKGNPFVKCLGILFVRFGSPPSKLWELLSPLLHDEESFNARLDGTETLTISQLVQRVLEENEHYGIFLPRIPTLLQREIKKKLVDFQEFKQRLSENLKLIEGLRIEKAKVKFLLEIGDEEWFDGTLVEINTQTKKCKVEFELGPKKDKEKEEETPDSISTLERLKQLQVMHQQKKKIPKPTEALSLGLIELILPKNNDTRKPVDSISPPAKWKNPKNLSSRSSSSSSSSSRSRSKSKKISDHKEKHRRHRHHHSHHHKKSKTRRHRNHSSGSSSSS